jgi:uncharacterized protein
MTTEELVEVLRNALRSFREVGSMRPGVALTRCRCPHRDRKRAGPPMGQSRLFAISLFVVVASAFGAQTQGFDCQRAKSTVERLICRDKSLGGLDGKLELAYRGALDRVTDPTALLESQRDWLRLRNACKDTACLVSLYKARIRALAKQPPALKKLYQSRDLGVSLRLGANRSVKPCERESRCVEIFGFQLGHRTMLLRLQAVDEPLEKAAQEQAGFELRDGEWFTTFGRFKPVQVDRFSGRGWTGMEAVVICGTEDKETGFHAAGGECLWAVLSNGRRSILATTDGYEEPDKRTAEMLGSLNFDR